MIPVQSQLGPFVSTSKERSWPEMSRAVRVCAGSLYKRIHFHSPACLLQSKHNATAKRVQCQGRPQRANAWLLRRALHLPDRSCPGPAAAPGARSSPCCESQLPKSWSCQAQPCRAQSSSPVLPAGAGAAPGAPSCSGPASSPCHVRDLFLLADMCVHMGTHGAERPRGVWHPVSSSPLFRGCEEHLNLLSLRCGATGGGVAGLELAGTRRWCLRQRGQWMLMCSDHLRQGRVAAV